MPANKPMPVSEPMPANKLMPVNEPMLANELTERASRQGGWNRWR